MSTLEISKSFDCPKQKLYKAWTDPEQLKQWWKPLGKELVNVEEDLVEGGSVKYQFNDDTLEIDGTYEKVQENDLLEYTWNWHLSSDPVNDASYKLFIRFEGDEDHSTIVVKQDGFRNEESIHPHQQGWEQGLQELKNFLEQSGANNGLMQPKASEAGYREDPEQVKVGGA